MDTRKARLTLTLGVSALLFALASWISVGNARGEADAVGVIAYKRGNEIRLVNSDGKNDRRLWLGPLPNAGFKGIRGLQWRPDGAALAFGSDFQQLCSLYSSDIYTLNADGSGLKRLTNSPACGQLAGLPKGTVKVQIENQTTDSLFLVYVEGAPVAETVTITPGTAIELTLPNVADLGNFQQYFTVINGRYRWIDPSVFVDVKAGQTRAASTRFILRGQGNVYADVGAAYPTWHRSSSKVGFLFYEGLMMQIGSNPPASGDDSFILAQNAGVIAQAMMWSPVSDWILYASSDHVSVVKPGATDGGTPIIDKSGTELVLGMDWLPDESGFLLSVTGGAFGQENSNIYHYAFGTNDLTQLTDFSDDFAGGLSISANGKQVVFEYADEPGDPPQLWIMDVDGDNMRPIGIQGESPDWKPGTGINFTDRALLPMVVER